MSNINKFQLIWICIFTIILIYFLYKQLLKKVKPVTIFSNKPQNKTQKIFSLLAFTCLSLAIITVLNISIFPNSLLLTNRFFSYKAVFPKYLINIAIIVQYLDLLLLVVAYKQLGKSFRISLEPYKKHLVIDGIYSYSRNPIYLCYLIFLLTFFIINGNFVLLLFFIVGYFTFNKIINFEEQKLTKQIGNKYLDYQKRVGKFL